jgi:hypothetical protein
LVYLAIFSIFSNSIPEGLLVSFGHIDGLEKNEIETESHSPQVSLPRVTSSLLHVIYDQEVADGIQDLLISMEMLFAAIAFTYSFSIADFEVYEKRTAFSIQEPVPVTAIQSHSNFQDIHLRNAAHPQSDKTAFHQNPSQHWPQVGSNEGDIQSTLLAAEQNMGGEDHSCVFPDLPVRFHKR